MGSVFALIVDKIWPAANLSPGAFALVAMGAVFGAASRAAFTFIIFAFEITRDYNSVLPLMLVTVIADAIAVRYAKNSIMTEKLARRGLHIHQDYEPDIFQQVTVGETMAKEFDTIPAGMRVAELVERITKRDPSVTHHQGVFIVDANGRLAGIITRADIMRALEKDSSGNMTVLEAGSSNPVVTYPNEVLYDAAARMLRMKVGRLPVCSWEEPGKPIGYLGRSQVMAARLRRLEEEYIREPGWVGARRKA
jgi:CBS domain-containing protein